MKKNRTVWSNRITKGNSKNFQRIGSSINIDKRLYKEDIFASIVHTKMLIKQKIIPKKDGFKIINGLKKIEREISKKKFKFKEQFEDIHQNIEKRLFQIIGESAGYLHTARSRNDQVVTDFKIWIKSSTKNDFYNVNIEKIEILKDDGLINQISYLSFQDLLDFDKNNSINKVKISKTNKILTISLN